MLAAVVRRFHDFADAEDAVQEALLAAAMQWPAEGFPENPRAWLIQVASRRMTDAIRSDSARRRREIDAAAEPAPAGDPGRWARTVAVGGRSRLLRHPADLRGSGERLR